MGDKDMADYGEWKWYEPVISIEHMLWLASNGKAVWWGHVDKPQAARMYVNWQAAILDARIKAGEFKVYSSEVKAWRKKTTQKTEK